MNDFFNNLVNRHLEICDTIQPRPLGRFETDKSNVGAADNIASETSEGDQLHHTSEENNLAESPAVTQHKVDSIEIKHNDSTPSEADKNQFKPSANLNFTEKNIDNIDSQALPIKSLSIQPLDHNAALNSVTVKADKTEKATLPDNIKTPHTSRVNNSDSFDRKNHKDNLLPISTSSEHIPDRDLNLRIQEMLQHLTNNVSSLMTTDSKHPQHTKENLISETHHAETPLQDLASSDKGDLNKQNNQKNDALLISHFPETKIPKSNSTTESANLSAASKNIIIEEKNNFSENENRPSNQNQLETSSQLSDTLSQLQQRLQKNESKTDPIINVTIGRVEIRAVQAETAKTSKQTKKPSGVMTLDDYLKQREGRGSK